MSTEDLRQELGLEVLAVSFDIRTCGIFEVPDLMQIPDDIRRIVEFHPIPEGTTHAYVTVYGGPNENNPYVGKISHYDIMYKHREGYDSPNEHAVNKTWRVDELLGFPEGIKVRE